MEYYILIVIFVILLCNWNINSLKYKSYRKISSRVVRMFMNVDFSWQKVDAHVYNTMTGTLIAPGNYASLPFNQHQNGWCGACYLVSVVQMIQDRVHVALGKRDQSVQVYPWVKIDIQKVLNGYQRYKAPHTRSWNACQGGIPLSVMNAIAEDKIPLQFENSAWLGYPNESSSGPSDLKIRVKDTTRILPTSDVESRILRNGPVVLNINAQLLKTADEYGIVRNVDEAKVSNHAVTVIGWETRNEIECWILRNSWGDTDVPKSLPSDIDCVKNGENTCRVELEKWNNDPHNPGYILLPKTYAPLHDDNNSPWFEASVELV